MNEILIPSAKDYAMQHQLELAEALGSGKDGIVFVAKNKATPADVAVEVLRFEELFEREKRAYLRLQQQGIASVSGFNVPQLLGYDDPLRVIQMTIVKRPFVLDFAGAYLDVRPEFAPEVWAEWEAEKREEFEERWPEVQRVLDAFEGFGVYLMDVSPANIAFVQ